jgi:hypothetical protein
MTEQFFERGGLKREIAVYSDDKPIGFWEKVPTFEKAA